jgi:small subunit ribosomal protein S6
MNKYELLLIIDNDASDEVKQSFIDKISSAITSEEGTVDTLEKWGTRKYAYPINFKTEGYYVLIEFTAPATVPAEIERLVRITDEAVRHMMIKK